jgi:tRNA A-37 threonylcarbamoyl transferase component Bud32
VTFGDTGDLGDSYGPGDSYGDATDEDDLSAVGYADDEGLDGDMVDGVDVDVDADGPEDDSIVAHEDVMAVRAVMGAYGPDGTLSLSGSDDEDSMLLRTDPRPPLSQPDVSPERWADQIGPLSHSEAGSIADVLDIGEPVTDKAGGSCVLPAPAAQMAQSARVGLSVSAAHATMASSAPTLAGDLPPLTSPHDAGAGDDAAPLPLPVASGQSELEAFNMRCIYRPMRTGFEEQKEFPIDPGSFIAGRYEIKEYLGSAAFSRAVQCMDHLARRHVCIKIIRNDKDYFDQSLDEIKLLRYVNTRDPHDSHHLVRMLDYFYHREHLFIVFELLRDNLYEYSRYLSEINQPNYFTLPRIRLVAQQVLRALDFLHRLSVIHADIKPENVLIRSYSRCEVKVIDLGSSSFTHDQLHSYVQSRSYRAPEVLLGLPYDGKIDIWSVGCLLAELHTGQVLFLNDTIHTILARILGILGPIPRHMILGGKYSHRYFTTHGVLYEARRDAFNNNIHEYLLPRRTCLRSRLALGASRDESLFADFLASLLSVDPALRPSAAEALQHPWLQLDG